MEHKITSFSHTCDARIVFPINRGHPGVPEAAATCTTLLTQTSAQDGNVPGAQQLPMDSSEGMRRVTPNPLLFVIHLQGMWK